MLKKTDMNRLNKIIFCSVVLSVFASCTNLETNELDSKVEESSGGGAGTVDPTEGLVSAYKDLGAYTDQANIYSLFEHTSDEMIPPTRGVDWSDNGVWRSLHTHTWDPTHSYILAAWNQLNQRAFRTNQILASSPTAEQAAEARFLRAFHMYHVMDLFGQVPFREFDEGVEVNPRVLTRAEAFDFIVADLEAALPNLPVIGPSATNSAASKAAANALLARLYLNKAVYLSAAPEGPYTFDVADMNKVIEYADAVTADGYSLQEDYFQNFSNSATSEIIFTSPEGSPQNRWFMTLHYNQNPSGWNGFTTLADFYSKFEEQDQRIGEPPLANGTPFSGIGRGFLVGPQVKEDGTPLIDTRTQKQLSFTPDVPLSGAATDKGIRVIKYHPSDNGRYILLRYADVFLMKAEAIMRGGSGDMTALEMVNSLRETRGASPLGSVTETEMLDERGRELYWEGVRRIDQIRFGTFITTWDEKSNVEPHRVLFPIPQQALDSNPNLQQNAGY
jgi:starch-binding outer membrane protein, SusD/RagB family